MLDYSALSLATRKSVENHGHPTVAVNQFQENLDLEHRIVQQNTLVLIKKLEILFSGLALYCTMYVILLG